MNADALFDSNCHLAVSRIADMGMPLDASLLALNDAVHQGLSVSYRGFGHSAEVLARLPREALMALIEVEKEFKARRQKEDIASARRRGVAFGRPEKNVPPNFAKQIELFLNGEISGLKAAAACKMPYSTFMWRARKARSARKREEIEAIKVHDATKARKRQGE